MGNVQQANIPKRFQNITLNDYKVTRTKGDAESLEITTEYIDNLPEHIDNGIGLLFVGPGGTGKTMLSCLVALSAISKGFSAYYTTVASYIRTQLQVMSLENHLKIANDPDVVHELLTKNRLLKDIRNTFKLLVLDDVGKEHTTTTKFAEDEIDFLLRYRFDKGLPTIISSNYPISQWAEMYSESMYSFIHEAFIIVRSTAKDYRIESKKGT